MIIFGKMYFIHQNLGNINSRKCLRKSYMLTLLLICPIFIIPTPFPCLKFQKKKQKNNNKNKKKNKTKKTKKKKNKKKKKNQPLGNVTFQNSPAAASHHFSEGSYSAYVLLIHDLILNWSGTYLYALLCDSCPFIGIVICVMICCYISQAVCLFVYFCP